MIISSMGKIMTDSYLGNAKEARLPHGRVVSKVLIVLVANN